MKLNNIRIVLVATTHPGNIGASCRAMKTMGIENLYLVNPNLNPFNQAFEMAAGADDLLTNAKITDTLNEALQGVKLVFATSARPRDIALTGFTPDDFASFVSKYDDDSDVAIIFGREHAGLTNEELLQAQYHIKIPSNPDFGSLNLSQAVQIICYELRMHILSPEANVQTKQNQLALHEDINNFYTHLEKVLIEIDFLKTENHKRIMQKLKRLFNRNQLENIEINILRGILKAVENSITT
jgi:tRNA (cytidine32/uridine32-2'-O)-methyltransferase